MCAIYAPETFGARIVFWRFANRHGSFHCWFGLLLLLPHHHEREVRQPRKTIELRRSTPQPIKNSVMIKSIYSRLVTIASSFLSDVQ